MKMLTKPLLKFNTDKTMMFYENLNPKLEKFELFCITEETIPIAPGMHEISARLLKDGAEVLAKPVSDIINFSLKLSTFPDKCKIAKLTPLFKKRSKSDRKNYKPISLLPVIS